MDLETPFETIDSNTQLRNLNMNNSYPKAQDQQRWWLVVAMTFSLAAVIGCGVESTQALPTEKSSALAEGSDANAETGTNVETDDPQSDQKVASTKPTQEKAPSPQAEQQEPAQDETKTEDPKWIGPPDQLLKDDSLDDWDVLNFGGEGDCDVENGVLMLAAGDPFTGVSSAREDLPKTNYEISLTARKTEGIDFFCGLTFPVAESHCTLIVGGWGGGLVGLSCIDDKDASQNDTQSIMKFEKDKWYKIRVRVQPENISTWIDDNQVVNQNIKGKKISLRGDVMLCTPLGVCSFQTDAEIKDIQIRQFKPMTSTSATSEASSPKSSSEK